MYIDGNCQPQIPIGCPSGGVADLLGCTTPNQSPQNTAYPPSGGVSPCQPQWGRPEITSGVLEQFVGVLARLVTALEDLVSRLAGQQPGSGVEKPSTLDQLMQFGRELISSGKNVWDVLKSGGSA